MGVRRKRVRVKPKNIRGCAEHKLIEGRTGPVGPLEQGAVFFERLRTMSPSLGLALSLPKSSLLWPSDAPVPEPVQHWAAGSGIPLVRGAVPLLGSMVGNNADLRRQAAAERVKSMEPFFRALRHPRFTVQAAFVLLRVCALPKFNFSCRTLPPRLTSRACAAFDQLVLRAATDILRLNPDSLPPDTHTLLTLPMRHGGFGLPPPFLAPWRPLLAIFPQLSACLRLR